MNAEIEDDVQLSVTDVFRQKMSLV